MSKLNNGEPIDLTSMDSIYDLLTEYNLGLDLDKYHTVPDKKAMSIISKNVERIVLDIFDYRSIDFDDKVATFSESLKNIPNCNLTNPLFVLYECYRSMHGDNNLLSKPQDNRSPDEWPLDFVLHKMYSEGFIPERDMATYKVSLESEVLDLVNNLNFNGDIRADDNTVPLHPKHPHMEVIHSSFGIIESMYSEYKTCFLENETDYKYTCTPSALVDKVYLCAMDISGFENVDKFNPIQIKLCQQVSELMYTVHNHLEKLLLEGYSDSNAITNLHGLVTKFVDFQKSTPSVAGSALVKLLMCCLIDATHLCGGEENTLPQTTLSSLVKDIDKYCPSSCTESSDDSYARLLNFQYLYNTVLKEYGTDDIGQYVMCESGLEIPIDGIAYETVQSASVDTYETSLSSLAEMFEVKADGTIKVSIKEKTTYMNEYAENHRLLKYNHQQKDYEGMAYNIIYHMILIDSCETNVLYNKSVKKDSDLYKDAEQARRLAKSDIAQYLPEIRKNIPGFNLNEMYRRVKADKATITIQGAETASGIKTIIKYILY